MLDLFFILHFTYLGGAYAPNASHLAPAYGPAMDGATCQLKRDAKIWGLELRLLTLQSYRVPGSKRETPV